MNVFRIFRCLILNHSHYANALLILSMCYNGYKNDPLQPPLHRSHSATTFHINYWEEIIIFYHWVKARLTGVSILPRSMSLHLEFPTDWLTHNTQVKNKSTLHTYGKIQQLLNGYVSCTSNENQKHLAFTPDELTSIMLQLYFMLVINT